MTRFRFVLSWILGFALVAVLAANAGRRTATQSTGGVPSRSFEFTYQVHVPANTDPAGLTRLRIPLPQTDGYQDIRGLQIDSPVNYAQGRDREYGNAFAAFTPPAQQSAGGFHDLRRFTILRFQHRVALVAAALRNLSLRT